MWVQRAGAAGPAAAASGGGSGKKGRDASYLLNFRCAERREAARPVIPARLPLLAIACVSTVAEQPALTPRRGAGGGARSCASTRTASCRPITGERRLPLRPLASCLALSLIVVHRLRGRFVVADGDYSVELAMPDKMVEWDVIREVRIRVGVGSASGWGRVGSTRIRTLGCGGGRNMRRDAAFIAVRVRVPRRGASSRPAPRCVFASRCIFARAGAGLSPRGPHREARGPAPDVKGRGRGRGRRQRGGRAAVGVAALAAHSAPTPRAPVHIHASRRRSTLSPAACASVRGANTGVTGLRVYARACAGAGAGAGACAGAGAGGRCT